MKFKQTLKQFTRSKTNWTAIIGVIVAVAGYMGNEWTLSTMVQMGLTSISALFIRDAIAGGNNNDNSPV